MAIVLLCLIPYIKDNRSVMMYDVTANQIAIPKPPRVLLSFCRRDLLLSCRGWGECRRQHVPVMLNAALVAGIHVFLTATKTARVEMWADYSDSAAWIA
jgi:hypothetical protein